MRSPLHPSVAMIHHHLGIAMIAAGTDILAADPRIESVTGNEFPLFVVRGGPFDFRIFTHRFAPGKRVPPSTVSGRLRTGQARRCSDYRAAHGFVRHRGS